jgi:hypothetical protein
VIFLVSSGPTIFGNPRLSAIAPESKFVGVTIRQLLSVRRGRVYRALYTTRGHEVHILQIRHAPGDYMTPADIFGSK